MVDMWWAHHPNDYTIGHYSNLRNSMVSSPSIAPLAIALVTSQIIILWEFKKNLLPVYLKVWIICKAGQTWKAWTKYDLDYLDDLTLFSILRDTIEFSSLRRNV